MKKILSILTLLILISTTVLAWDDCPFGLVNDSYPGECGRYVDTDVNQFCDHSEPIPKEEISYISNVIIEDDHDLISGQDLKLYTVEEIAVLYGIDSNEYASAIGKYYGFEVKSENSFQLLHDNYGLEPSVAKEIALSLRDDVQILEGKLEVTKIKSRYNLLPISLSLILLYLVSYFLSKKKIISVMNHRKIWNGVLLFAFLISAILGILLVIRIDSGLAVLLPFNILFWHVELGIVMALVSIFHILWHIPYFKNMFKIKKN